MPASDESPQPSFEVSLAELEAVVHDLEEGQLGLAEALARYEEGVKHLKNCYQLLQEAERKIELLTGISEEGTPLTQPFVEGTQPASRPASRRRRAKSQESPGTPPAEAAAEGQPPRDIDGPPPSF
jgi:exodeoxyribonuclease VII small subunit